MFRMFLLRFSNFRKRVRTSVIHRGFQNPFLSNSGHNSWRSYLLRFRGCQKYSNASRRGTTKCKIYQFFHLDSTRETNSPPFFFFHDGNYQFRNGKILYNQTFVSIFLSSSRRRKNREEQRREEQRDVEIKVWKYSTLLLRLIKHCDSNFSRNRRMDDEPEIERKVFEGSLDRR